MLVESLRFFRPELALLAGAVLTLFSDFFCKDKRRAATVALTALAAAALLVRHPAESYPLFGGFFALDGFTHFFRWIALGATAAAVVMSASYPRLAEETLAEYYSLLLFSAFALILMAGAVNLLAIFLAMEFVSLVSYLLTGFLKKDEGSKEAALKYVLFGSAASALMVYGMSILYGLSGSLDLDIIRLRTASEGLQPAMLAATLLILAGLGFKISMVPFHFWAPDVYQGAPTPVTAFLTVAPKALGFALIVGFFSILWLARMESWTLLFAGLAILTMTLGNLTAIAQSTMKRLLAYSSIAQAGYMLMGVAAFNATGITGVGIYLALYALMNLGAFTIVIAASNALGNDRISSYAGLARRSPALALSMTIFLLSLAGLPPLGGFIAKFYVFAAAVEAQRYALVVAAALNSAAAAFYYFKVVRAMYLEPAVEMSPVRVPLALWTLIGICMAGTVLLGVWPLPLMEFAAKTFSF